MNYSVPSKESVHFKMELLEIIGESEAIQSVKEKIRRVSDKNVTVLIRGESGTGKDLVARNIHDSSQRKKESFIHVNCAALPRELLESELFGYNKGAFTGAKYDKLGGFGRANGGTIFLDEIGALSYSLQGKILQVLEDRKMSRLGSVNDVPIDVRILAATNSDLEEKIVNGDFRSDLYYRLNVISIEIPPLRERKEDIPLLANHFMHTFCDELNKEHVYLDRSVMEYFQRYDWPGNVRELENMIKGIIALQNIDSVYRDLRPGSLADAAATENRDVYQMWDDRTIEKMLNQEGDTSLGAIRVKYLADVERQAICKALELTQWNRKRAAQLLQVSYKTLLNKTPNPPVLLVGPSFAMQIGE
jgi:transcriptional regulator with PAS, ATPase and Fis domain